MGSIKPLSPNTLYIVRVDAMDSDNVLSSGKTEGLTGEFCLNGIILDLDAEGWNYFFDLGHLSCDCVPGSSRGVKNLPGLLKTEREHHGGVWSDEWSHPLHPAGSDPGREVLLWNWSQQLPRHRGSPAALHHLLPERLVCQQRRKKSAIFTKSSPHRYLNITCRMSTSLCRNLIITTLKCITLNLV